MGIYHYERTLELYFTQFKEVFTNGNQHSIVKLIYIGLNVIHNGTPKLRSEIGILTLMMDI
jgi:hypothetical protein